MTPFARPAALIALALAPLLPGCLSSNKLVGFVAEVVSVDSVTWSGDTATITTTLRYINETLVPVGITSSEHELFVDGQLVAKGETERPVGTRAGGSNTGPMVFQVTTPAAATHLRSALARGRANYELNSLLHILSGREKLVSETHHTGSLDLSGVAN